MDDVPGRWSAKAFKHLSFFHIAVEVRNLCSLMRLLYRRLQKHDANNRKTTLQSKKICSSLFHKSNPYQMKRHIDIWLHWIKCDIVYPTPSHTPYHSTYRPYFQVRTIQEILQNKLDAFDEESVLNDRLIKLSHNKFINN